MAVSNRLRYEILRRDGFKCVYCGASARVDAVLEIDHVLPKVLGGTDRPENLVAACEACNSGKSSIHPDSPVVAGVDADALRWAKAVKRAGAWMVADAEARDAYIGAFDAGWRRWGAGDGEDRRPVPKPDNWEQVVGRLYTAGLPIDLLDAEIENAMTAGRRAEAVFQRFTSRAQSTAHDIRAFAEKVIRGELSPDVDQRSAREFARSLLTDLDDDDREAAIVKVLTENPDAPPENTEPLALDEAFGALLEERWRMECILRKFIKAHPADEVAKIRSYSIRELERDLGFASPREILMYTASNIAAELQRAANYEQLSDAARAELTEYVSIWLGPDASQDEITKEVKDQAWRLAQGESSTLPGMCTIRDETKLAAHCHERARYATRYKICEACTSSYLNACDGDHGVCERHMQMLSSGQIYAIQSGDTIKLADAVELAVSA